MISLDRAVTLAEMNDISKFVCHDLKLNMSRMTHKMFHIHCRISERHLRFLLCSTEAFFKILRRICNTHSFATTAKSRLDNDRITDRFRFLHSFFYCIDRIFSTRNDRDTGICHRIFGCLLISKTCNYAGRWSDKSNITLFTELGKTTVLRKKTKSRMNCIGSCNNCRTDDIFHAEIALG